MSESILLQHHRSGISQITFNRPHVRNALDIAALRSFAGAVRALRHQADLRVVVISGAGDAFCAGGDLNELSQHLAADDARRIMPIMGDALSMLEALPVPVIAAINGFALGGGSEIAIACDLRVMAEDAHVGFVQARRGLIPGWGGGQRLIRLVGYARAMALLLGAEPLDAETALKLGLANRIAPAGEALSAALEWANAIAEMDADAVRGIKALALAALTMPYEEALRAERALFPELWAGRAHQAAMRSFIERKK